MKRRSVYTQKPVDRKYQYSPAVVHQRSGLLFVSGVCGWDRNGTILHAEDAAKQARVAFENLGDILKEAGATFADVLSETEYVVDLRQYKEIAKVRSEYFPDNFPAATLVGVSALFKPGLLFEIQTIVALQ